MRLKELPGRDALAPTVLHELGLAAWLKGDAVAAREFAVSALASDPDLACAYTLLGAVERSLGASASAVAAFERAWALRPEVASYATNLATALAESDRNGEAIACLESALRDRSPDATLLRALGEALIREGVRDEGIARLRAAVEAHGADAETWFALGLALQVADDAEGAIQAYLAGLCFDPKHAATLQNLGRAYSDLANLDAAEAALQQAGAIKPEIADIWANLAVVRRRQGRLGAAVELYHKALALEPGNSRARYNLGMTWLLAGDFVRGWHAHEARRDIPDFPIALKGGRDRAWDGRPLAGRTLLVHAEQGLGDTLQFIRYLPLIGLLGLAEGSRVVLMVPKELLGLLGRVGGVAEICAIGSAPPNFDVHVPLLSLPHLLGTTVERIPAAVPYIHPNAADVEAWKARLGGAWPRVGFVWAGNPTHGNDRRRSLKSESALRLARAIIDLSPKLRLYGLQIGRRAPDLDSLSGSGRYVSLAPDLTSFEVTAAAVSAMDLVVCVDTSVAHLAGAMGLPALVILPSAPDWRWRTEGARTPWYPTLHLARCAPPGDAACAMPEALAWLRDWVAKG